MQPSYRPGYLFPAIHKPTPGAGRAPPLHPSGAPSVAFPQPICPFGHQSRCLAAASPHSLTPFQQQPPCNLTQGTTHFLGSSLSFLSLPSLFSSPGLTSLPDHEHLPNQDPTSTCPSITHPTHQPTLPSRNAFTIHPAHFNILTKYHHNHLIMSHIPSYFTSTSVTKSYHDKFSHPVTTSKNVMAFAFFMVINFCSAHLS